MAAPPKVTTPNYVLKYTFLHELGTSEKVGTSMYFTYSSSAGRPTQANLVTLATTAYTAWGTDIKALYTSNGLLAQVSCQDIYDTSGALGLYSGSTAGTRSGSQPVTFACANVGYQISQHYRGGKPKGFWPLGIASDTSNQSDWGGTFIGDVNTGIANLAAAIAGSTAGDITVGAHSAVSFYSGAETNTDTSPWAPRNRPKPRGTAVVYPVTGYQTAAKIASQRRRRV